VPSLAIAGEDAGGEIPPEDSHERPPVDGAVREPVARRWASWVSARWRLLALLLGVGALKTFCLRCGICEFEGIAR
jgi:hypothetical protein